MWYYNAAFSLLLSNGKRLNFETDAWSARIGNEFLTHLEQVVEAIREDERGRVARRCMEIAAYYEDPHEMIRQEFNLTGEV